MTQREMFAKQLMMLIRKSGMRQIEIAAKVGVSSAAISQFVHGVTLPTQRHINAIFEVLKVQNKTRSQLQYLLMLARSEPRKQESTPNLALFPLRAKHGLTLDQVSARTDIPIDRLLHLEQDDELEMSAEERQAFARMYGNEWSFDEQNVAPGNEKISYDAIGAPQIMVSDLLDYDRDEPLESFARRNIRNFLARPVQDVEHPVIAQAFSKEVGFLHDGLLQIVLAETRPSGYAPMELRLYEGGIFRLWQPHSGRSESAEVPTFETHGTLIWAIPVVEVILLPLKIRAR